MRNLMWLAAAALLGVTACQPAETPEQIQARMEQDSEELRAAVASATQRWEAWTAAGQTDSFATLFTEQGRELPPNAPPVAGREAIAAFHAQQAAMGSSTVDITSESVMAYGPLGIDRGTFTSTLQPGPDAPPGIPTADTGKYLVHWHKVDGNWLIADLIWNSDLPLPQPER